MKSSDNMYVKAKKLTEYLKVEEGYSNKTKEKKPKFIFAKEKSRLLTSETETPEIKEHYSSSFYDNFEFVDRLTNNKMAYKEARKSSNSLLQFRKTCSRLEERSHMHSLLQIYKKTKKFEMNSLKKKIFKNFDANEMAPIKIEKELLELEEMMEPVMKKCESFSAPKKREQSSFTFVEQSKKKNKLRSFIDKNIKEMNKAELKRICTENDGSTMVREEVLQFNEDANKIKCSMDKERIDDLVYLREKQEFELGNADYFKKRDDPIVFKDLTNFKTQPNEFIETENNKDKEQLFTKPYEKTKKRKPSQSQEQDIFLEKMLTHAKNCIYKEGEYLITPSREKQAKNMLVKKGNKKFILSGYKNSASKTEAFDLSGFSFEKKPESSLVQEMNSLISNNNMKNETFSFFNEGQSLNEIDKESLKDKHKDIVYLMRNNYISNLGIELTSNPESCFVKDEKGNNLIHMAIKFERPEVIDMFLNKVPELTCQVLLNQRNNNKRTPLELANILLDRRAIEIIEKFNDAIKEKELMQNWMIGKIADFV